MSVDFILPVHTAFSRRELKKENNKIESRSCCMLVQEHRKTAKDVNRNKAEKNRMHAVIAANVHPAKTLQLSATMMTNNKLRQPVSM